MHKETCLCFQQCVSSRDRGCCCCYRKICRLRAPIHQRTKLQCHRDKSSCAVYPACSSPSASLNRFCLQPPRTIVLLLKLVQLRGMPEREPDIVESFEQTILSKRIDIELRAES